MTPLRSLLLCNACILLSTPGFAADRIDTDNPPQGRFSDEWAEIYLSGGKVGYSHSTMAREGDFIHTELTMKIELGRVGRPVSIGVSQKTTETLQGVPVTFESAQDLSVMTLGMKGRVKDGKVTIVQSQYGMEQTQTFDFPKGALMSWGLFRESLLKGFKPGTTYTQRVYEPGIRLDDAITATTTVGDMETFEKKGKTYRGRRVSVVMQSPIGEMELVSWVDENGSPVRAQVPMPGLGNLEILASDQKTALSDFVPPELFLATTVKANRSIDRKATRVKYRISSKEKDTTIGELPDYAGQSATVKPDGSAEVIVRRALHGMSGANPKGADKIDLSEYLDGNLMININDPMLQSLSRRASKGEKDPFALADNLRRFVTDYVENKNLNIGFATASEVCRNREGDCSEHGVLLAALGRLCGLPSRVVVGVVYLSAFGGQSDVFGYHLWTQFYIDKRWIDFDAALRETECSPIRIAFATSSLKNTGMADLSLPLINKIGAIDIEILEVETNPSTR